MSLYCTAPKHGYSIHFQAGAETWECKDCGWTKTVHAGELPYSTAQGHVRNPPEWVRADPICCRLWQQDADWRQNAVLVGDNQRTQRLLIKLASQTAGGAEGEAVA